MCIELKDFENLIRFLKDRFSIPILVCTATLFFEATDLFWPGSDFKK